MINAYMHNEYSYEVWFLKEEESMDLLCEKVFGDEVCPPQLHKSATKIAKLCEGLPLLIVTVTDIISKSGRNRNPTYWKDVAEKKNSVFTDAYNKISKGSHWKTKRHSFSSLEFLLIEESDLVQWKPGYLSFLKLKYLSLKHCYKLKEIHRPASVYAEFGRMIIEIELEDCNPLALTWASQLQPTNDVNLCVIASSSFYEKPTTFNSERDGADYISGLERSILGVEEENDDEDMSENEDTDKEDDF
ncbi:uncharacterized protein LOC125201186 isoform X4 [Salvia hispanica]|uniref:uncharacterized protein LOC125201186 isoform X4 n=1 Tax=Salvia hispanica TaxID=49212 RepID=UPI0020090D0B|nr:uncharacterized protein LOC125201186 isoform X4 [Salvia hispanica]